MSPGVTVRHVSAGPFEGLAKEELPAQLCAFTAGVLREEAQHEPGYYDLVHSHYWLSGQVGWLARDRWGVPLVHTAHTLAKVKNAALADGDRPEPRARVIGEEQVVAEADRLIANTDEEARQLVRLYGADPRRIARRPARRRPRPLPPGRPRGRPAAPSACPRTRVVLLFVGRIQPLKAPDVLLRAAAELLADDPALPRPAAGARRRRPSGSGPRRAPSSCRSWPATLGIADLVALPAAAAAATGSPTTTGPPTSPSSRATTSPSAWSRWRPRPAARRWSRPRSAACRRRSATACPGVLVDGHDPARLRRARSAAVAAPGRELLAAGARRHAAPVLLGPHRRRPASPPTPRRRTWRRRAAGRPPGARPLRAVPGVQVAR